MEFAVTANANSSIPQVPAPVNIVNGTHPQLIAFLVLNMWPSHLGIPALLAVILFKKVHRHPTFVNLCITFMIVGMQLFQSPPLRGKGNWTRTASRALPSSGFSTVRFSANVFLANRASYYEWKPVAETHAVALWAMLIAPYACFFVGLLATSIVGAANPPKISRSRRFFYCSVESNMLTNSLTVFAAVFLIATVVMEVWVIVILYRRRTALRRRGPRARGNPDLSMPIRILAYGFYIVIALSLSLLSVKAPESPVPDLIIASAASVFLIIFGSQKDILLFWRKEKPPLQEASKISEMASKSQMPGQSRTRMFIL